MRCFARSVALLALLRLAGAGPLEAQDVTDARVARLREYLAAAASLGHLNGSVLIAERGKILIDTAYGFANIELGVRNTPETRFRVASITKQFTAMAVMMLAQEGKLAIADPIAKWVDSLPPAWSGITIHQLLRHTSGISDYEEWFQGYMTQEYSNYMAQEHAPARILRDAKARPLDHEPGTTFRYSNSAYILLGYLIERASGMSYDEFLRTRIHAPLGMTLSGQDRSEIITANRAQGYRMRPGAYPERVFAGLGPDDYRNAVYQLMEPPQGDAGLLTTARDLYKWDQALYTEQLLPKRMLDSIFTPGLEKYGYGWFVSTGRNGLMYEHSGGLPGFSSDIMRLPDTQRTIIILNNVEWAVGVAGAAARILRGEPVPLPHARRVIARDSLHEARLVGSYRNANGDSVLVRHENGRLSMEWAKHFRSALLPESGTDFIVEAIAGTARFSERGDRGVLLLLDAVGATVVEVERRRDEATRRR
jgi:CubicO group peptidase (beta-lactamase class C family)